MPVACFPAVGESLDAGVRAARPVKQHQFCKGKEVAFASEFFMGRVMGFEEGRLRFFLIFLPGEIIMPARGCGHAGTRDHSASTN